jgi:two-component system, OmpR family, response regulator
MTPILLKKILFVEDDPDMQIIARFSLESLGHFEPKVVSSGRQALNEFLSFSPQLILLDVMMPEMDGPSTLKEFQKMPEAVHIPIVFMTAKTQKSEIENYLKIGATDVIQKPFDPMVLSQTVQKIWDRLQH